jgi:hypothetical protein
MADPQYDAQSRIQALMEYLRERELDLETIAESKRQRLEQGVQLQNFEVEARQVGEMLKSRFLLLVVEGVTNLQWFVLLDSIEENLRCNSAT